MVLSRVWAEDLERLVRGWVEGERGAVWAMEVGARPVRSDTSQRQSPTVATRVGLRTAGAPANLPSRPGRKGWRGQKRPH